MESILKKIQGQDKLIYTHEEATELNELNDRVKGLYPRNKEDEKMQAKLQKEIEKLRGMILKYSDAINELLMTDEKLTDTVIEKLQKQFRTIDIMHQKVFDDYNKAELKYN